jgi:hypothetical protein
MEFTTTNEPNPEIEVKPETDVKPEIEVKPETEEEQTRLYRISAEYKKATYETEQWINFLKNGKRVRFEITTYFRWGNFEIELTDKEKEELLKKDHIILNDYCCSCEEMWDGCDRYEEIDNKDSYSAEELKEIYKLIYYDDEDDDEDDYEYDSDEENNIDEDLLEKNGWSMDDTIYGLSCKCVLEDIDAGD